MVLNFIYSTLLTVTLLNCLTNPLIGSWMVCQSGMDCSSDETEAQLVFSADSLRILIIPGGGLDPIPLGQQSAYNFVGDQVEIEENGLLRTYDLDMVNPGRINLISVEVSDTLFLFKKP